MNASPGPTAPKALNSEFTQDALYDRLLRLYRISTTAGGMAAGIRLNPAGETAADEIYSQLTGAGASRVHRQYFEADRWWPEGYSLVLVINGEETTIPAFPLWYSSGVPPTEFEVVDVGFGTPGELRGKDVRGKAVVLHMRRIFHFVPTFEKFGTLDRLVRRGAAAVVVMDALLDSPGGILAISHQVVMGCGGKGIPCYPLPAFSIGRSDGLRLLAGLENGRTRIKARLETSQTLSRACNVIAEIDGNGESDEVILAGGHYDTWFGGALDNLSSQASLIELARYFAAVPLERRPRKLIFAAIFGHEFGNLGHLTLAKELREIAGRITCFVDLDGAGSTGWEVNHQGEIIETGWNDVCGIVASSNALADLAYRALYEQDLFSFRFTDNAHISDLDGPLSELGIPTLLVISKHLYYHTPLDTPERIPPEILWRRTLASAGIIESLMRSRAGYFIATNTNPHRRAIPGLPRQPDLDPAELPVNPRPWVDGPPQDLMFEVIPPNPRVGSPVIVWRGHAVTEGIGRVEEISWRFGNLTERIRPQSKRGIASGTVYLTPGIKTIRMTVTDRFGRSSSVERKIGVTW